MAKRELSSLAKPAKALTAGAEFEISASIWSSKGTCFDAGNTEGEKETRCSLKDKNAEVFASIEL